MILLPFIQKFNSILTMKFQYYDNKTINNTLVAFITEIGTSERG